MSQHVPETAAGYTAADNVLVRLRAQLPELTGAIAEIESSSLYFHLFETRFSGGKGRESDFGEWVRTSLGDEKLADKLGNIDPYMFSLEQVRRTLLTTLVNAREGGRN